MAEEPRMFSGETNVFVTVTVASSPNSVRNWISTPERMKLDPCLIPHTKSTKNEFKTPV